MRYMSSRKYPITQLKKNEESHERILDMSVTAAAGLAVLVFAEGFLCGYMLKKH